MEVIVFLYKYKKVLLFFSIQKVHELECVRFRFRFRTLPLLSYLINYVHEVLEGCGLHERDEEGRLGYEGVHLLGGHGKLPYSDRAAWKEERCDVKGEVGWERMEHPSLSLCFSLFFGGMAFLSTPLPNLFVLRHSVGKASPNTSHPPKLVTTTTTNPPKKERRRRRMTTKWRLAFSNCSAFGMVVAATHASGMQNVEFKVSKEDGVNYISVNGRDLASTVIVRASLRIDELRSAEESFTFCLNCSDLMIAVPHGSSLQHQRLVMECVGDEVIIKTEDTDVKNTVETRYTLPLYENDVPVMVFEGFDYDILLEVDVVKMRNLLAVAHKVKSEHVTVTVQLMQVDETRTLSSVKMSLQGKMGVQRVYRNETQMGEDGSTVVRAAGDLMMDEEEEAPQDTSSIDSVEPVFHNTFATSKMESFLKVLPGSMVAASVSQDKPIVFHVPLLGEDWEESKSNLKFIMAPTMEGI